MGFFKTAHLSKIAPRVSDVVKNAPSGDLSSGSLYKRLTAADIEEENKKKMGMKKGGSVSSASKRADGIATKGKTRGRMV